MLAEAVHEELPGHTALRKDEASMSGAGGEMSREVSIWGRFGNAPREKQQLPLNTGKKILNTNSQTLM